MVEALKPLLTPQRKFYRLSRLCGRSRGKTSFTCTDEGVFIAKGDSDPCDYLTTLMTIWLPWPFDFTWIFVWQVGLFDFHITLNSLILSSIVEMWMTWPMTRLDMTVLVHSCSYWCACHVVVFLGDGCPHGVSQFHVHMEKYVESSMVVKFTWCFLCTFLLTCMLAWLTSSTIHESACSSVHPCLGGVACFTSQHKKPFSFFIFVFFKRIVHRLLFIFRAEDESQLIQSRRGCSLIESCKTPSIGFFV